MAPVVKKTAISKDMKTIVPVLNPNHAPKIAKAPVQKP